MNNNGIPAGSAHDDSILLGSSRTQLNDSGGAPAPLPKCFCNWKHCRTYQKAFREFKHPLYNGVVKLKFYENDSRSMALKASIDRTLGVDSTKRSDWKGTDSADAAENANGDRYCRYYVARHHYTEVLMKHYLTNRRTWDWNEPLDTEEAQRFLYSLSEEDICDEGSKGDVLYVQCPNVPKDQVRETLKRLKDEVSRQRENAAATAASQRRRNSIGDASTADSPDIQAPQQPQRKRATQNQEREEDDHNPDDSYINSTYGKKSANGNNRSKGNRKNGSNSNSTKATSKSTVTKDEIVIDSEDYDDSDEEYYEMVEEPEKSDRKEKGNRNANAKSSKSRRKVEEDDRSSASSPDDGVREENVILKNQLDDCQKQISMLQNMLEKLRVHVDPDGTEDDKKNGGDRKNKSKKSSNRAKNNASSRRRNSKQSYSSEEEDDDDDDDDDVYLSDVERDSQAGTESSSEDVDEDSSEEEAASRNYGYAGGSGALQGNSRRQNNNERPRGSRQSLRRGSIHSRRSMHGGSIVSRSSRHHSRRGSMRGGGDDGASVMSRQSLQSISVSIKSLPREIELMDDEDDEDYARGNKDDSSFFDDTRSLGSRSAASRVSRRSMVSGSRIRNRKSVVRGGNANANANANANRGKRSNKSNGGAVPQEIDLSGDELENLDVTHENVSTDTLFVTEKQIVDPYGEKGIYTGALSKSTCMPNGKGRLEYEKESRWYEGDWIHGRWTGYGRLSNGDGDFYEGGLKNDHKHGTGVMRFADGRVFEGEYIRGQMIQGKMTYQDGSVYGGSWVDGMRHGRGKCIFVDGSEYEGEFREGNFHGHGKMTWNDGGWYVGNWSNGEMDGQGKEVRPDGSLRHDGEWAGGQPIRSASDTRRRRQQQQAVADDAEDLPNE
eukprot:CAMPEP_0172361322 /NCGR_PEP_ID=MMETSP1060-20121228/5174_1 /TAXON_ID=37318 /ORGANISM="Pseudo-nitzschia pungens, Strain cf. cingulata" /LENGTH=891 /DNA_ID=CAMNT_0013083549 /DNA_START=260 /DNA_END=2935 /DNA_ORIENTATION=+